MEGKGKRLAANDLRSMSSRPGLPRRLRDSIIPRSLSLVLGNDIKLRHRVRRPSDNIPRRRDALLPFLALLTLLPFLGASSSIRRRNVMRQHIHIRPDMQMTPLQRPLQRERDRRIGRAGGLAQCGVVAIVAVFFGEVVGVRGEGPGRHATGHGHVGVDVVFEEVVEFIGEGGDGAGDGFGDAIAEGEWEEGLVAGGEGDVLEFSEAVCYL